MTERMTAAKDSNNWIDMPWKEWYTSAGNPIALGGCVN